MGTWGDKQSYDQDTRPAPVLNPLELLCLLTLLSNGTPAVVLWFRLRSLTPHLQHIYNSRISAVWPHSNGMQEVKNQTSDHNANPLLISRDIGSGEVRRICVM
ncbi:hypothetical protein AVEN_132575-1 [Araneus ventricosus]|uniref:Uncharacterized protein n=1 Tax=Araneus ventricosus TaxID=182803 RepID=A0A4Y2T345_ARAVE|nr:hypothetical protein AVEN_132575-1 [Araneus ventricosus]